MFSNLKTPLDESDIRFLRIYDQVSLSGYIFTGRDVVLPKLVDLLESNQIDLSEIGLLGSAIFHSAVSPAGIGPTSSNKMEIEESIVPLSKHGVRLHIGKGAPKKETIHAISQYDSAYAIVPPVSALLTSRVLSVEVMLFPEAGMEAFHLLKVSDFPVIIAGVNGNSIFD